MKMEVPVLALFMGWGSLACGVRSAPPMDVGESCARGDLRVQVAAEHPRLTGVPELDAQWCAELLATLEQYREAYEARFGHQQLAHIPVRIQAVDDLRSVGAKGPYALSGATYADAIDLALNGIGSFPHELNHVRSGPSHDGWCIDYEPWSEAVLGIDQRSYLKCGSPRRRLPRSREDLRAVAPAEAEEQE
ncbi:MAG TPA: hypothetical protein VFN45_04025 [Myxococcaceae bacterium]|nr:hypothetical protein [Myxococcaceae bacterium]